MLEKTLESPLDSKEIQPVNPKGNQLWLFTGRTEAEAPILWPRDANTRLTGRDLDAGIDAGQEDKGVTEEEMVGWHHRLNGHEFEKTPGDSEGQRSLVWYSLWCCKKSARLSDWSTTTTLLPDSIWFRTKLLLWHFPPIIIYKPKSSNKPFMLSSYWVVPRFLWCVLPLTAMNGKS